MNPAAATQNTPLRAAVYGSGVSGLMAAYALTKCGVKVGVIDPYGNPILQSLETEDGIVELAANSILSNLELEKMFSDIELQAIPYTKLGRYKFVYSSGAAKRWPLNFWQTLKSTPFLMRLAFKSDKMKPKNFESIDDWGRRVLNPELLNSLIKPGLQGVYGFDVGEVSASLALQNLFKAKKKSKLKGSVSFSKGMGMFTEKLKTYLKKNGTEFKAAIGEVVYDFSIVSSPTHSLPDVVSLKNKKLLSEVTYKEIAIGTFIIDKKQKLDIEGFGCVFKEQEEGALGLILNSDLFPKRSKYGYVSETWISDGRKITSQYEMEKAVVKLRQEAFGKTTPVKTVYFKHWPKAFPTYSVELEKVLKDLEQDDENVFFFANWTGDLGIGSMARSVRPFVEDVLSKVEKKA